MSINTAHANGGVLIHAGECILLYSENVTMEFNGQDRQEFKGSKVGKLFLTTHRMIFLVNNSKDKLQSFSFPFGTLKDVEVEQPIFGANHIKGKVHAQPNGNWEGVAKFKLCFKSGGAIEFAQAMLKAATMATRGMPDAPPPYSPPSGPWYAAPPPAYTPPQTGYYGWVPPTNVFPGAPPVNTVFMTDQPPPYPGINSCNGYPSTAPPAGAMGFAPQSGTMGFAPQSGAMGFAPQPGAMGFTQQPANSQDAKASEAAQSAYYDPNRPQCAYVPPPAYYEPPPSYQESAGKKNQ